MMTTLKSTSLKIKDIDLKNYETKALEAINDVNSRAGKDGQFLNWIQVLPQNQIENLETLYKMAQDARDGKYTDLAILGIGGSRHTTEALLMMLGKNTNVHFYSSIDPTSFERFASNLDLDKTQFLVVSKSGGTLETTVAYENARALMQKHLGREDVSDRFIAMTDANAEKSALRRLVDKKELCCSGYVHDDVGGRFSIFDDATLFALFFIGESIADVKSMLSASLEAQKEFLSTDLNNNDAIRLAMSNVYSYEQGKIKHFVEYFGDAFMGTTLWEKQLKNESLKATISTDTNVGPGYLHYNAESDLDPNNKDSFFTFVYVQTSDRTTNALIEGVVNAYGSQHNLSEIVLSDLSYQTIARFIELKHFETLYTGNILRRLRNDLGSQSEAMAEVLQPNVEIYKREVKKALSN